MSEKLKWAESNTTQTPKSTLEEQDQRKDSLEYSNTLMQVNNILDKVEQADEIEQEYREKLIKLDSNTLKELSKQDSSTLNSLLPKPQNKINAFLIQAQINGLKAKGLRNLSKEERVKFGSLKKELIAIKDSSIEIENKKQDQQKETIASKDETITKQNSELKSAYHEVNSNLLSIKGSLDSLKWINNDTNQIFVLLNEVEEYNIKPDGKNDTELEIGTEKMNEALEEIITILRDEKTFKSIANDLKEQDQKNGTNNFDGFKNTLINIDRSFIPYFNDLEKFETPKAFSLDEIAKWIENNSGAMLEIDLKGNQSVSKLSLFGSDYSFDKEIDKQELNEIMGDSQEELWHLKKHFASLTEFETSYATLRDGLWKIWWDSNFKDKMNILVQNFSTDVFSDFDDIYKNIDVPTSMQIKESDISSFRNVSDPWDLESNIKSVFEKIKQNQKEIAKNENVIVHKYETEIKELLQRKTEDKEKQLETLKFLRASGFDQLPKWISNRVIKELQGNVLTIPWLDLARENINLKNGNFWESGAFSGKEDGLNIESKTNLVKFINKIISWDVNEPLWVEAIANGTTTADPRFVKSELMWATRKWRTGWHYSKVIENLKKENR